MLQKTTNGNLLKVTAGDLAKECCCGGTSPSSCPSGNPEMYLTIFDADYAGGGISWCGQNWSQTDIQNGVEKGPVCPSSYVKKFSAGATSATVQHRWAHTTTVNKLTIERLQLAVIQTGTPNLYYVISGAWSNKIFLLNGTVGGHFGVIEFVPSPIGYNARPIATGSQLTFGNSALVNIVNQTGAPTPVAYGGYTIPTNTPTTVASMRHGSYTTGGIQYSWRPGNGVW